MTELSKGGRPTLFSDELADLICDRLAEGRDRSSEQEARRGLERPRLGNSRVSGQMRTNPDRSAQGQPDKEADKSGYSPFRGNPVVRPSEPLFG